MTRFFRMNFVEEFFQDNGNDLLLQLQDSGFSREQAVRFLPEASASILKAFHHKAIEEIIAAISMAEPSRLLKTVNTQAIAEKLGMNAYLVRSGFETFAPAMARAFSSNRQGVVAAAASIAWGVNGSFPDLAKQTFEPQM